MKNGARKRAATINELFFLSTLFFYIDDYARNNPNIDRIFKKIHKTISFVEYLSITIFSVTNLITITA